MMFKVGQQIRPKRTFALPRFSFSPTREGYVFLGHHIYEVRATDGNTILISGYEHWLSVDHFEAVDDYKRSYKNTPCYTKQLESYPERKGYDVPAKPAPVATPTKELPMTNTPTAPVMMSRDQLLAIWNKIDEDERGDVRGVFASVLGNGFDAKTINDIKCGEKFVSADGDRLAAFGLCIKITPLFSLRFLRDEDYHTYVEMVPNDSINEEALALTDREIDVCLDYDFATEIEDNTFVDRMAAKLD